MLLGSMPRVPLATLPTPVLDAGRLRAALGGPSRCPRILIKRDDLTGLALGGNKARKLEFLIADALAAHATVVITSGAAQSNHARMTAAAACAVGLKCVLVLTTTETAPPIQGNLLLDVLFGAEVRYLPAPEDPRLAVAVDEAARVQEVADELRARGERPYIVPIGGSSAIGVMGYVSGTLELVQQLVQLGISPSRLYFASGSRGTQAGLELGARLFKAPYRVVGIAVSAGEAEKKLRAERIGNEAAERLGDETRLIANDLLTEQGYIGPGYGLPTAGCVEAIRLLATTEGILLDPTYTGKAMAGLIDHVRSGQVSPHETVVFLHTGGVPALFAHAGLFA